ncbi:MAG TPA: hypothetical protein VJR92_07835, partial [Gemmatimonadaceae bacterium]|nr:hypothetical protein [Gemmatimonadaceae bacterium]
ALPRAEQVDDLWRRARESFGAAAVRDGGMLAWRYAPARGAMYEAINVRSRSGVLEAIAIVRRPSESGDSRLRGIRVASLSDLLFSATAVQAGVAVIAAAERAARRMGADALLCSAAHASIVDALKRRAFLKLPGNVHLMVRDPQRASGVSTELQTWWVTRGDAQSDESF